MTVKVCVKIWLITVKNKLLPNLKEDKIDEKRNVKATERDKYTHIAGSV
jgi:hypothetical protein